MRIGLHLEAEAAIFRFVTEGSRDHVEEAGEEDFLGFDGNRAGFDFREVENVADEIEKVGAGAVDGAGELDLLRQQVAVWVVAELLAEDENAVERRAQLVGHVRQEVRLVLRGEREFLGLFLERAAGLLDFLVFAFDFDVLFGKLLSFLGKLLVGLLQFFLLRLKLGGELLRLLQQTFRLHGGFNAVEHDADAGGELFEEAEVRSGEDAERRQLDDGLHTVFEQHRQHDHVARHGFEQPGADRHGVFGGRSVMSMRRFSTAHWPTRPSPTPSAAL